MISMIFDEIFDGASIYFVCLYVYMSIWLHSFLLFTRYGKELDVDIHIYYQQTHIYNMYITSKFYVCFCLHVNHVVSLHRRNKCLLRPRMFCFANDFKFNAILNQCPCLT